MAALRKAWDRALRSLGTKLNTRNVDNFLRPLKPLTYDGQIVVLGAPSAFAKDWAEKKYTQMIRESLEALLDVAPLQIRIVISKPESQPILGERPQPLPIATPPAPIATCNQRRRATDNPAYVSSPFANELVSTPLNEKYTFDTFVIGKSNRLAHAGAMAVSRAPGQAYNPLFIYGTPGLGKTHLMHAVGHEIRRTLPHARVACVSGEMFTNHYVKSLRERETEGFRNAYRSIDVWLVDDIQTIASMKQTKEEFFHTFNTLHQMNKQIVITSDCSPRELRTMDERIRSRFEQGLTADVAPPELEMRKQILEQKSLRENMGIPEDVIHFMANLIQSNIRALEGALIKLLAYASLAKSPVTKQLASDVLSGYYLERMPAPSGHDVGPAGATADQVIDTVAVQLGITREQILRPGNRRRDVAFARQVAMYLSREMTKAPMTALAATFGCRHHSAIAHAHARLDESLKEDPKLLGTVANIRKVIEYSM